MNDVAKEYSRPLIVLVVIVLLLGMIGGTNLVVKHYFDEYTQSWNYQKDMKAAHEYERNLRKNQSADNSSETGNSSGSTGGNSSSASGGTSSSESDKTCKRHLFKLEDSVEATCETDSTEVYVCRVCGEAYVTHKKAATGHTADTSLDVVKKATCIEQGYTTHTCKNCNTTYVDSYTEALGHSYVKGICSRCGHCKIEDLDPGLYTVNDDGTYTQTLTWNELTATYFNVTSAGVMSSKKVNTVQQTNICSTLSGMLKLDSSVTSIKGNTFRYCDSISQVYIPKELQKWDALYYRELEYTFFFVADDSQYFSADNSGALYNKTKTTLYRAPVTTTPGDAYSVASSVTRIEQAAFCNKKYSHIELPDELIYIGNGAFRNNPYLTSMTIPSKVSSLGTSLWAYNTKMTSLTIASDNTHYVEVNGIVYNASMTNIVTTCRGEVKGDITIISSVTVLSNNAFEDCDYITSVTMTDNITSIGTWAFGNCNNLKNVYNWPSKIHTIPVGCFRWCPRLTFEVPSHVTKICYWQCGNGYYLENWTFEDQDSKWVLSLVSNGAAVDGVPTEALSASDLTPAVMRQYFKNYKYYNWVKQ